MPHRYKHFWPTCANACVLILLDSIKISERMGNYIHRKVGSHKKNLWIYNLSMPYSQFNNRGAPDHYTLYTKRTIHQWLSQYQNIRNITTLSPLIINGTPLGLGLQMSTFYVSLIRSYSLFVYTAHASTFPTALFDSSWNCEMMHHNILVYLASASGISVTTDHVDCSTGVVNEKCTVLLLFVMTLQKMHSTKFIYEYHFHKLSLLY